ncbi:MAG: hypothetical protein SGI77_03665 [Pirellulaceae bacterium]|nr:hypothetical protein [Pirellulaceae bacterium]
MNKKLLIVFFALLSIGIVFLQIGNVRAQAVPSGHVELKIPLGDLERRCVVHLPPEHNKTKPIPFSHYAARNGWHSSQRNARDRLVSESGFGRVYRRLS